MTMEDTPVTNPGKMTLSFNLQLAQWWTQGWVIAGLLFVLALATRLPFRSEILYHWDSINFAYAIQEFNLAKEQPQPPGYIVYVWLCRLVDSIVGDAQMAMVGISLVSSTLAVVALFYMGEVMFDRSVGLLAALFLATSPLFWFYSEIALPHTLDTLLVVVSVWWMYKTMRGDYRFLYPAVVALALAGGIRQQTLIFLAPVFLFAVRGVGWRRFLIAGILGGIICLGWFIPLMILSGGLSTYMEIVGDFTERFQRTTSIFLGAGWWGVQRNLIKLTLYTTYAWSLAALPAVVYVVLQLRRRQGQLGWERSLFLFLWMIPALLFYALVHMGQQGLVFVFLPALLLFSAYGLTNWLSQKPRWLAVTAIVLVTCNVTIFYWLPEYPFGLERQRFLTRNTLTNSDHYYQDRFKTITKNFNPQSTIILAANWHHVEYYLPEYSTLSFNIGSKWEIDAGVPTNKTEEIRIFSSTDLGLRLDAKDQAHIIIFDPELVAFNQTPDLETSLPLPHGGQMQSMELGPQQRFYLGIDSFGLLPD